MSHNINWMLAEESGLTIIIKDGPNIMEENLKRAINSFKELIARPEKTISKTFKSLDMALYVK